MNAAGRLAQASRMICIIQLDQTFIICGGLRYKIWLRFLHRGGAARGIRSITVFFFFYLYNEVFYWNLWVKGDLLNEDPSKNSPVWELLPRVEALPTLRPWPGFEPDGLEDPSRLQSERGSSVP